MPAGARDAEAAKHRPSMMLQDRRREPDAEATGASGAETAGAGAEGAGTAPAGRGVPQSSHISRASSFIRPQIGHSHVMVYLISLCLS